MSSSQVSSQEIRAAAEAHRELGPEYHDAVVESFLAKVEKELDARIEARLAFSSPRPGSRQMDPATLANRRQMLKHMALGSVGAAIPLSFATFAVPWHQGAERAIVLVWIAIAVLYAACAIQLRPPPRDPE